MSDGNDDGINRSETCRWFEVGCWTALLSTPFLYWTNGPAVSQDQLAVRWIIVILALVGAVGMRLHHRLGDRSSSPFMTRLRKRPTGSGVVFASGLAKGSRDGQGRRPSASVAVHLSLQKELTAQPS